jgi:hypothetical protein
MLERSDQCVDDNHNLCPHAGGFGSGLIPGPFRLEKIAVLCPCECHSACPATSTRHVVPKQTWRESCTCPGAEVKRVHIDQAVALREAYQAARAGAAGMSREQIKELYKAELRARELDDPPDAYIDAQVSLIAGDVTSAMHGLGHSPGPLTKLLGTMFRPPH